MGAHAQLTRYQCCQLLLSKSLPASCMAYAGRGKCRPRRCHPRPCEQQLLGPHPPCPGMAISSVPLQLSERPAQALWPSDMTAIFPLQPARRLCDVLHVAAGGFQQAVLIDDCRTTFLHHSWHISQCMHAQELVKVVGGPQGVAAGLRKPTLVATPGWIDPQPESPTNDARAAAGAGTEAVSRGNAENHSNNSGNGAAQPAACVLSPQCQRTLQAMRVSFTPSSPLTLPTL